MQLKEQKMLSQCKSDQLINELMNYVINEFTQIYYGRYLLGPKLDTQMQLKEQNMLSQCKSD